MTQPAAAQTAPQESASDFLHKAGIDLAAWGWFGYTYNSPSEYQNSWRAELELDITKSFGDVAAVAADLEFTDFDDKTNWTAEQLFASLLLSRDHGIVLTIGKFNSPIGAEGHDFWDRYTATTSLLFQAQPQDLRGAMLTTPLGNTNITLKSYVVSGFGDKDAVKGWPSIGMTADYHPDARLGLAITGWIGPAVAIADYADYGMAWGDPEYNDWENHELVDPWWSPPFKSTGRDHLYFFNAHATIRPRPDLTLIGEFIYGATQVNSEMSHWLGLMFLANFDFDDHLRAYAMWSYLDDTHWVVYPPVQRRHAAAIGVGYRIDKYIELRAEYRHDFSDFMDDVDRFSVDASIGY